MGEGLGFGLFYLFPLSISNSSRRIWARSWSCSLSAFCNRFVNASIYGIVSASSFLYFCPYLGRLFCSFFFSLSISATSSTHRARSWATGRRSCSAHCSTLSAVSSLIWIVIARHFFPMCDPLPVGAHKMGALVFFVIL